MTREQVRLALDDHQALVATLYSEAAGESLLGQIAVGCAIRNRVHADLGRDGKPDWWGESFAGVCLARLQFSAWWETNANSDRLYALAEAMLANRFLPDATLIGRLAWIADGLIGDLAPDVTNGSTHYLTTQLLHAAPPKWARGRIPTVEIGRHSFFAGVES